MNMIKYIRTLIANDKPQAHAKAIINLLKRNDIRVAYNDKLKSGGRSLKIYNPGVSKARITKVKKLLANKKNVTVKNWPGNPWDRMGVIRVYVK